MSFFFLLVPPNPLALQSPHPESHPVVEWKPRHIDLGREASIMHVTLSSQLKILKFSDAVRQTISPLPAILEVITRVGDEDEGDPLTSTIEALRVMQTTNVTQFGGNTTTSGDNSDSSSEYTTPAQSQATSPSHEQSPPPPGVSIQSAHATVTTAARLMTIQTATGGLGGGGGGESSQQQHYHHQSSVSPSTSPTHGERVSSLATHSHSAHLKPSTEGGNSSRRKSDSEVQRHRVRPASQQLPGSVPDKSRHAHSLSIDCSIK